MLKILHTWIKTNIFYLKILFLFFPPTPIILHHTLLFVGVIDKKEIEKIFLHQMI